MTIKISSRYSQQLWSSKGVLSDNEEHRLYERHQESRWQCLEKQPRWGYPEGDNYSDRRGVINPITHRFFKNEHKYKVYYNLIRFGVYIIVISILLLLLLLFFCINVQDRNDRIVEHIKRTQHAKFKNIGKDRKLQTEA